MNEFSHEKIYVKNDPNRENTATDIDKIGNDDCEFHSNRQFADAYIKIYCKKTNLHVGFDVVWNTSEFGTIWFKDEYSRDDVIEVPQTHDFQKQIEKTLLSNPSSRNGLFAQTRVFTTPCGPSMGPEMLVMVLADEQWGDRFWYAHVIGQPGTAQFVATLFRSNKFINGATIDLLFQRLFHWTVVDPQIQAPRSKSDGDCFGYYPDFNSAVDGLSRMIECFDELDQMISSFNIKGNGTEDARMIDFYDQWGDYIEITEAFPIPPVESSKMRIES